MAQAYAHCKCSTCGEEFTIVSTQYNRKSADGWAEWASTHYTECAACRKKRIARERKEELDDLTQTFASYNFPALSGSAKQIEWATTIRLKAMKKIVCQEKYLSSHNAAKQELDDLASAKNWVLSKTSAGWWIDNGLNYIFDNIHDLLDFFHHENAEEEKAKAEQELVEQTTITPAKQIKPGVVVLKIMSQLIIIKYEKDDDFRTLVKSLGCHWSNEFHAWTKQVLRWDSTYDRAAEIGYRLLQSGFAVSIKKEEVRRKAVQGEYQPEITRVITADTSGLYEGCFVIKWTGYNDALFKKARALPQSRYRKPNMIVPGSEYKAVEDFAKHNDFFVTDQAKELIEKGKSD